MPSLTSKLRKLAFKGLRKSFHAANNYVIGSMEFYHRLSWAFHRTENRLNNSGLRRAAKLAGVVTLGSMRNIEILVNKLQWRVIKRLAVAALTPRIQERNPDQLLFLPTEIIVTYPLRSHHPDVYQDRQYTQSPCGALHNGSELKPM